MKELEWIRALLKTSELQEYADDLVSALDVYVNAKQRIFLEQLLKALDEAEKAATKSD